MICTINGYSVMIDEYDEGFGAVMEMGHPYGLWIEIDGFYPTDVECQQAAMMFISGELCAFDGEVEKDNYRNETTQFFDRRDHQ